MIKTINTRKKAFITGIEGQDGWYLARLLADKGYYEVFGLAKEKMNVVAAGISELPVTVSYGDATDRKMVEQLVASIRPDECYHLAAQSSVLASFADEARTLENNIASTHNVLSAVRELGNGCRFYFAASSEMFGKAATTPQNELTPLNPVSPYAISKVAGFYLTKIYREMRGMFACSGILFNHESPRRPPEFVSRKITSTVAKIKYGIEKELRLGNLDARRDWGFAGDYVEAMWLMLQQQHPDDYVIGTGETHSVREFVETAFKHVGLDWRKYVTVDPAFFRNSESKAIAADFRKAERILHWKPRVMFHELVRTMVDIDLDRYGAK